MAERSSASTGRRSKWSTLSQAVNKDEDPPERVALAHSRNKTDESKWKTAANKHNTRLPDKLKSEPLKPRPVNKVIKKGTEPAIPEEGTVNDSQIEQYTKSTKKRKKRGGTDRVGDKRGLKMTVTEPLQGSDAGSASKGSTGKKHASTNGRPPTTSVLRSAMYYQNRIIIPEPKIRSPTKPPGSKPTQGSNSSVTATGDSVDTAVRATRDSSRSLSNRNATVAKNSEHVNSVAVGTRTLKTQCVKEKTGPPTNTMDSRGIDIIVTDTEGGRKQHKVKKKSVFKRISHFLQDNRMRGHPDADRILAGANPEEYIVLKRVLNILFLTIGIALLVAVLIVIIYTTIDPS